MNNTPLPTASVAPDFILSVLVDEHRQQSQHDPEADPSAALTFATTVAEWRGACDLIAWRPLGRALNAHWQIHAPDDEWHLVLEPARQRTLLDVCRFISDRAQLPQLIQMGFLGARCSAATAFLGIRALLATVGYDSRSIRPRTELAPYLRSAADIFTTFAARTAPGSLPPIRIETPAYDRTIFAFVLSVIGCLVAAGFHNVWLASTFAVLAAGAWIANSMCARYVLPRRVTFGNLKTFADYANTLSQRNG